LQLNLKAWPVHTDSVTVACVGRKLMASAHERFIAALPYTFFAIAYNESAASKTQDV
jgi:hypothetical protein